MESVPPPIFSDKMGRTFQLALNISPQFFQQVLGVYHSFSIAAIYLSMQRQYVYHNFM